MELDVGIKEGIMAGLTGIIAFVWKRLNGSLSREEFKQWCEKHEIKVETQRKEFRETLIGIFTEMKKHVENDATAFARIEGSLGRLEERSSNRRRTDE